MLQIVLPTVGIATLFATILMSNNQNIEDINAVKSANEIMNKKEDLKEFSSIKGVSLQNRGVNSENEIASDNINKIIIPNEKASRASKLLTNKYQKAIDDWYKHTNNPSIPNCTQLSSRGIISLAECNEVETIEMDFYSFNGDTISYKAAENVADKIKKMTRSSNQAELTDNNNNKTFIDLGRSTASYDSLKFENDSLKKERIHKKVVFEIEKDPYKASRINNTLATIDPILALNNAIEISKIIQNNPSLLTTTQIKEVAKQLKKTEVITKNTFVKNVDANTYSSTENMNNFDSTQLHLYQKIQNVSNFTSPKLTVSEINSIQREVIDSGIISTDSINNKFNLIN